MKPHSGFTLIELMVVIALAAILLVLATPSFRSQIQNNRAATQANDLLTALNLARSEAIKRGIRISVCSSADQSTCAGSTNWATGWIVFTDTAGTAGVRDPTDTVLRVWQSLQGNPTLTQTAGGTNVQYQSSGAAASAASFTLKLPDCSGSSGGRAIDISATGRSSVTRTACP